MKQKIKYIIAVFAILAACFFVCARPYLTARETFSFTEAETVSRVENRSVFVFPQMELERGNYTIQCNVLVPSEIEISLQEAADEQEAVTGAFRGVTAGDTEGGIEMLPVRIASGEAGIRSFRVFVNRNHVPARVVIREYYESGGVPQASFDVNVVYRPGLSASYAMLDVLFRVVLLAVVLLLIHYRIRHREDAASWIPLCLFALVAFISLPLLARFVPYGHDAMFHVRRIANLAEEVFSGRIPVRIAQTWKNGYGYPVSIFYGDILMLEAAVLFRLGVPLWRCCQFYLLSVNLATVVFSFYCFKKLSGNAWYAFFGSVCYAASVRYLANLYLRGAVGEGTAMAFLPLVVLGFYELFAGEERVSAVPDASVHRTDIAARLNGINRDAVFYLVFGFTLLIQSHTLMTIQTALFAALFCLLRLRDLLRGKRLLTLCVSAFLTFLLNLWFIVPFVDYYARHAFYAKLSEPVADSAVKLSELVISEERFNTIGAGTLLCLLFAVALAVILHEKRRREKLPVPRAAMMIFSCEVLSFIAIWMGTELFPWKWLEMHLPAVYGVLGGRMQYVWRYFSAGTVLACVTMMLVLRADRGADTGENRGTALLSPEVRRQQEPSPRFSPPSPRFSPLPLQVPSAVCFICAFTVCVEGGMLMYDAYHPEPDTPVIRAADVWNGDGGDALYMFDDLVWHDVPRAEVLTDEGLSCTAVSHSGTTYEADVENKTTADLRIVFPVWNYYGYRAKADDGTLLAVSDGEGHRVSVTVPAGFSGHLTAGFQEPWYWRMAEAVSVFSVVVMLRLSKRKK